MLTHCWCSLGEEPGESAQRIRKSSIGALICLLQCKPTTAASIVHHYTSKSPEQRGYVLMCACLFIWVDVYIQVYSS